ncbi:MAG: glutamine--fructose-6-phosphate transaminase (isomerizing) [Simkaniaceae bacterium]|nr:glutamine--fructose-6-phosphate transaminase (isomerizing) [Simkaniaceae bacterium]
MCGIFGYIGPKTQETVQRCLEGLKRLEYRGYDSAGIAGLSQGRLITLKSVGKVENLCSEVENDNPTFDVAIAHTRWATHGKLTKENAHPHYDHQSSLAIVHNGIIENYADLKDHLKKHSIEFASETDSEVIAQMVAHQFRGDLLTSVRKTLPMLKGSFALAMIHKDYPETIVATARECPLVIATDRQTGETYISSDTNAFSGDLDVLFLKDDEVALINRSKVEVYASCGKTIEKSRERLGIDLQKISKEGYEHYMLKEIFEQPYTIKQTLKDRYSEEFGTAVFEDLKISPTDLQATHHILILACGTSWHAGCVAASMLENLARIPTQSEIASEFRYTNPIVSENTLVIAISQSGETADTLAAVREVKAKGAKVIGLCNVRNSTLTREAHSCLFLNAGPEVSVCSTKAFTSQLTLLSLFTLYMARLRHMGKQEGQSFLQDLRKLPRLVESVLLQVEKIEDLARAYAHYENFFFLGRRYMFPASLEAALKLKEISYLNAIGYPAGEMKHGPIALICENLPVIAMCGNRQTQEKMMSNLMEIKSRGSPILAFAPKGCEHIEDIADDILWLPNDISDELACIPYSVAAQLFAYYIAVVRQTDIDQPRNLAKSVTVE